MILSISPPQLLKTDSSKSKQEISDLEKKLINTSKELEQINKENSEVCLILKVFWSSGLCIR